ncbi:hypothetical protein FLA_1429 [Filimonas lacunae]|nr:hypothetical protein FLA_1429 [Filimonas lacunae]
MEFTSNIKQFTQMDKSIPSHDNSTLPVALYVKHCFYI